MPWVAKIKREDPFRPEDSIELYAQCKRIAAAAEHFSAAGWREAPRTGAFICAS